MPGHTQLDARDFLTFLDHPFAGRIGYPKFSVRFDGELPERTLPPLLGEHNEQERILALADEIALGGDPKISQYWMGNMLQLAYFDANVAGDDFFVRLDGLFVEAYRAEKDRIDMVILDLNMPKMNGIEFLKAMQGEDRFRHIPVVIISTEGKEEDTVRGLKMGAKGYVKKPFQASELHSLIEKITGAAPFEFFHSRAVAECCGDGGLLPEVDPALAERLIGKGYDLAIYDAHVNTARLTGANKALLLTEAEHDAWQKSLRSEDGRQRTALPLAAMRSV